MSNKKKQKIPKLSDEEYEAYLRSLENGEKK